VFKQTASWIVGHHHEWGQALAGFFRPWLVSRNLSSAERNELQR